MGYRSDVRCLIYGEPDKIAALVARASLEGSKVLVEFNSELSFYDIKASWWQGPEGEDASTLVEGVFSCIDLNAEGVKWYDSYDDVMAWHAFMETASEMGLNYEFIRIGEEDDDIQRESMGDHNQNLMFTETSIRVDLTKVEKDEPDAKAA